MKRKRNQKKTITQEDVKEIINNNCFVGSNNLPSADDKRGAQ